jgi:hypothetical protein
MKLVKEWLGLWIDDPNSLSLNAIYLTHILATVPSKSVRMARVGEMRDFSFIIELKSQA